MARMASIFTIKGNEAHRTGRHGFTLVELMIASVLSAIVFAAIFSAYIFMARNLTRMANFQQLQVQNRRALFVVTKDVSDTTQVLSALPAALTLKLSSGSIINYAYDSAAQTLTRQVGATVPVPILLSNLVSLTFTYFDGSGTAGASTINIKQVELRFDSVVGDRANGTQAHDSVVSARMVLRGKPSLGQ